VNDVGDSDQVPFDTVNTCDTVAVPVTAGATVFTGKPATKADDADQTVFAPSTLEAVTAATTNFPAWADVKTNVDASAPEITEHVAGKV
jgi:hypothetical protein